MKKNNIKVNDKRRKRILFVQNVINHLLRKDSLIRHVNGSM